MSHPLSLPPPETRTPELPSDLTTRHVTINKASSRFDESWNDWARVISKWLFLFTPQVLPLTTWTAWGVLAWHHVTLHALAVWFTSQTRKLLVDAAPGQSVYVGKGRFFLTNILSKIHYHAGVPKSVLCFFCVFIFRKGMKAAWEGIATTSLLLGIWLIWWAAVSVIYVWEMLTATSCVSLGNGGVSDMYNCMIRKCSLHAHNCDAYKVYVVHVKCPSVYVLTNNVNRRTPDDVTVRRCCYSDPLLVYRALIVTWAGCYRGGHRGQQRSLRDIRSRLFLWGSRCVEDPLTFSRVIAS